MTDDPCAQNELARLIIAVRAFTRERDWEQYHSPKNLAMALSVEAAELLEHFQWLTEAESRDLTVAQREAVSQEMADVLIYLLQLSDKLEINLTSAAWRKMELNAAKYPADQVRGRADKYTAYE